MIYQNNELFTPELAISQLNYILMDITVVEQQQFKQKIQKLSQEGQEDLQLLKNKIIDTLLSVQDLNQKIKAVILNHQCFIRQFKPIDQQHLYPQGLTPYQYLISKYQNYLKIGYKINLTNPLQIEQLQQKSILKKIKLFSFDIKQQSFTEYLPILRKYVKLLFNIKKKTQFHIKLNIKSTNGLRKFKEQIIIHQYPIQFCILQTNLLSLIQKRFDLNMIESWQEIAFKYTQVIKKYIPCAIGGVLQNIQAQSIVVGVNEVNAAMQCLNKINQNKQNGLKQYKKFHNGGIAVFSTLLLYIFRSFSSEEYDHFRVRGSLDYLCFNKLYDISRGKYTEIQQNL